MIVLKQFDWFKHGDHIRRIRARKHHECSLCSGTIKSGEFYVSITGLPVETMFSSVNVCTDCFFPADWVDDLEYAISLASGVEPYD